MSCAFSRPPIQWLVVGAGFPPGFVSRHCRPLAFASQVAKRVSSAGGFIAPLKDGHHQEYPSLSCFPWQFWCKRW